MPAWTSCHGKVTTVSADSKQQGLERWKTNKQKKKRKKKEICPLLVQQPETSETNKVLFWTTELGPVYPAPFADLCDTQAVDFGLVCRENCDKSTQR